MQPSNVMVNNGLNAQKLAVSALKQSSKEFSFNERVVYIDTDEIRYYSKVCHGLTIAAEGLFQK